jgi:hypothetical protein
MSNYETLLWREASTDAQLLALRLDQLTDVLKEIAEALKGNEDDGEQG